MKLSKTLKHFCYQQQNFDSISYTRMSFKNMQFALSIELSDFQMNYEIVWWKMNGRHL